MTPADDPLYSQRGVSASKEEVHAAVGRLPQPLFHRAFCRLYPDVLTGNDDWAMLVHGDGAGTKAVLAYLWWKETGDLSVWKGIARDVVVMNTDDVFCTGAPQHLAFCSLINRNRHLVPGAVLNALVEGTLEAAADLEPFGVHLHYMGGETADVGDAVRTLTVDGTLTCRLPRNRIVKNEIRAGDLIVGFASFGQTTYERAYNSGIGCNGLTSARHDVLQPLYGQRYPETVDPATDPRLIYCGSHLLSDTYANHTVAALLLSPTRTYVPLLREIHENYIDSVSGIIHCTGGGQTKVLHFIDQLHVVKDNLFPLPPVFELIRRESRSSWKELYAVYNMGHRLEVYCTEPIAEKLIALAAAFRIEARIIGRVNSSERPRLTLTIEQETVDY
ncbi:MAG: phosphoribosylformylglycinamidine cyclo-ligase [Chitinophagales bacterium]|nr:phosphoribosylformylglycinamidine cyclo-ligase [Chitinophagales bacterium]MDW8392972.1 phosphoribosylformylglycinamidine cyclo-ligase [Chitinophagales bacterium]